jgi:hypothetical protein
MSMPVVRQEQMYVNVPNGDGGQGAALGAPAGGKRERERARLNRQRFSSSFYSWDTA